MSEQPLLPVESITNYNAHSQALFGLQSSTVQAQSEYPYICGCAKPTRGEM